MRRTIGWAAALWLALPAAVTLAAQAPSGGQSPYVDQQTTAVRGLSADEIAALRTGQGMGLARAAELNGYPGPRHVLDLADALALSAEQRATMAALFQAMEAEAIPAGERLLAAHAALELAFRERAVDTNGLAARTAEIGRLEGELRAIHLKYHLLATPVLTASQLAAYPRLRGYTTEQPSAPHAPGHTAPGHGH
jgi:hypothetical protein